MTDYTELVKALRYCAESGDFNCNKDCPMYPNYPKCLTKMDMDAAAAIEELQQIADHYEQTAKDYWKEACEYKAQLPKRGEWLNVTDSYHWYGKCSVCGEEFVVDAYYAGGMNYCPNCGAKMGGTEANNG